MGSAKKGNSFNFSIRTLMYSKETQSGHSTKYTKWFLFNVFWCQICSFNLCTSFQYAKYVLLHSLRMCSCVISQINQCILYSSFAPASESLLRVRPDGCWGDGSARQGVEPGSRSEALWDTIGPRRQVSLIEFYLKKFQ